MGRIAILALSLALAGPVRAGDVPTAAAGTLRVGVPAGPDAMAGFDRSLFAEAAREAGLGVAFEVLPPAAALAGLDAGRVDVAAGPFRTEEARGRRALAAVAAEGDALLKRRGDGSLKVPGDAAGKVLGLLGAPDGTGRLRAEIEVLHARATSRAPAFADDPLRDLAAGRVAVLAGTLPDVAAAALARPDAFESVGPLFGPTVRLAPLMRADRPELAAQLGAALGRMAADGRLAEVQRRWFGIAFDATGPQPVATAKP